MDIILILHILQGSRYYTNFIISQKEGKIIFLENLKKRIGDLKKIRLISVGGIVQIRLILLIPGMIFLFILKKSVIVIKYY